MTTERTFTPITPEGLRGLGATRCTDYGGCEYWSFNTGDSVIGVSVLRDRERWSVSFYGETLGEPADLETVADLIDVLRRMNGGG